MLQSYQSYVIYSVIFVGGAQQFSGGINLIDPMGFMNGIRTRHCFALCYASVAFAMFVLMSIG